MLISLPGSEVAHHPTVPPGPHCPRVEPAALPGPGDIEVVLVPICIVVVTSQLFATSWLLVKTCMVTNTEQCTGAKRVTVSGTKI